VLGVQTCGRFTEKGGWREQTMSSATGRPVELLVAVGLGFETFMHPQVLLRMQADRLLEKGIEHGGVFPGAGAGEFRHRRHLNNVVIGFALMADEDDR